MANCKCGEEVVWPVVDDGIQILLYDYEGDVVPEVDQRIRDTFVNDITEKCGACGRNLLFRLVTKEAKVSFYPDGRPCLTYPQYVSPGVYTRVLSFSETMDLLEDKIAHGGQAERWTVNFKDRTLRPQSCHGCSAFEHKVSDLSLTFDYYGCKEQEEGGVLIQGGRYTPSWCPRKLEFIM